YGTIDDTYFASLLDPDDPDSPQPLTSHDGDNGFFYWLPMEKDVMVGRPAVRVDLSQKQTPVLDLWYQGQGSMLDVLVAPGNGEFETARTIDLQQAPVQGWTLCRVPLSAYKDAGTVRFEVRLRAVHNTDTHIWSVPIDHISIHDLVDKDLRLVSLACQPSVKAGSALSLSARVENTGTADVAGAVVSWSVNGLEAGRSDAFALEANGFATVGYDYEVPLNAPEELEITARVLLEGDANAANDAATATVAVKFNNFPTVDDLSATPTGNNLVTLAWSAPSLDNLPGPETVTDDFDNPDYPAMSISGAGQWTVHDGDGGRTYNIFRELYNPYQTQPIGFQLFDRVVAQVTDYYWLDAEPHSGSAFMMAPSCQGGLNDNWLISPRLSGNAQTVTFWAKSFSISWPESFEVYY
ncbi:MAG: hypothetical protein K2O10_07945, partial [Muribaculaceae bacterium]|nr:hypothetical protein [Muribaculaceae bacterium]